MNDDFEHWLTHTFTRGEEHVLESGNRVRVGPVGPPVILAAEQVRRLISYLGRLAGGVGEGQLSEERLAEIRANAGREFYTDYYPMPIDLLQLRQMLDHADALSAALTLAEGVLADMKDDRLAYALGVEAGTAAERGRAVRLLQQMADAFRAESETELSRRHALRLQALTLDDAATRLERGEAAR